MAELATRPDIVMVKSDIAIVKSDVASLRNEIDALRRELEAKIDTQTLRLTVRLGSIVAVAIAVLAGILKLT